MNVGIARANKTLNGVKGTWVKDQKVKIADGKVSERCARGAVGLIVRP
ncbi:MAG TPA: dodecin domain-containing protein [Polyangia bacterium]|nr:dodecin domain-containing protein [Polyangia bacterium]